MKIIHIISGLGPGGAQVVLTRILENDKVLKSKIGENFCNAFVEIKRDEAVRLQDKNIDEIREYYLPFV